MLAVRYAMHYGASEAEAFVVKLRGFSAKIRADRLEGLDAVDEIGVGIRVAVGKKVGFAYASGVARESLERAAADAVSIARASKEDPYWAGFAQPSSSYPEPESIYEPQLASTRPELVVEKAKEMIDYARGKGVRLVFGGIDILRIERAVTNTSGVYRVDVGTVATAVTALSYEVGGRTTPVVYNYDYSRITMPSIERLLDKTVEEVLKCKNTVKVSEAKRMDVVLTPKALASLFHYTIGYALRGDNAVRKRSPYFNKLDEQVLDERLTIIDDGVMKNGFNTWRFDGEGTATRKNILVEKGVLRNFVYDNYWGHRAGSGSTGNAVRTGYTSPPAPGYTNVIIEPGDLAPDELLEGTVLVAYQVQGAHSSNPDTGEYSVLANPGIIYRNGEVVGWAPGVIISGNMYEDLHKRLYGLSKLVERGLPGFNAPMVRLSNLMVAPKH